MSFNVTVADRSSRKAGSERALSNVEVERSLDELRQACDETYKELLGYAFNLVESPETAQDIVQQAFANTLSVIERGGEVRNMGGFLYRCVRNLCVNNSRLKPLVSLGDEPYIEAENLTMELTDISPAISAEIMETWRQVEGVVDKLTPNQRHAFLLAELRGYGYDEIAESMNRSTNSVRQLLSRARKKIRKISNAGSDWVGIPTPALQAGLAFARDVRFSVNDVLDRAQEKVMNAQAWLGNIFHNAQAVLQYGAYIVAGAAVIVLGSISPASSDEQSPSDTDPVASVTQQPRHVVTHTQGSTVRHQPILAQRDSAVPTDTGRESNVDHGQSRPNGDSDRRTSITGADRNEDSGGKDKPEGSTPELNGQDRRLDRRSDRRQDRRADRRQDRHSDRCQDRRQDQLRISQLPAVEDSQPSGSAGLPGDDRGTGTSESPGLKGKPVDDTVSYNDSIDVISSVGVNVSEGDGGSSVTDLENGGDSGVDDEDDADDEDDDSSSGQSGPKDEEVEISVLL